MSGSQVDGQDTGASRAFKLRKSLHEGALASQLLEHDFYEGVGVHVEGATFRLCGAIAAVLQSTALTWSESMILSIPTDETLTTTDFREWQAAAMQLKVAEGALKRAQEHLSAAKELRAKFGGFVWGAKAGYEKEWEDATTQLSSAEEDKRRIESSYVLQRMKAETIGSSLLEKCVARAIQLATSPLFGVEITDILQDAANRADASITHYRDDQTRRLQEMRQSIDQLIALYGPNERTR